MKKFGVFYTCYTEKQAVEFSLDELFNIYPEVPVYLISDGGEDFSFLEKKYKSFKALLEEDSRTIIPQIRRENFKEEYYQNLIKKSIITFLSRIERAINFCQSEYILIMEPDILVRGVINIPENSKLLGSKINSGLSIELKNILKSIPGAKVIDSWGATPAIFNSDEFLKIFQKIKENPELFNELCLSDYRLAFYDVLLAVLFAINGHEEWINPEITECFRNPDWENSSHPLLHQFRAKYPLISDGYNGTHTKHIHGLGDSWLWKR